MTNEQIEQSRRWFGIAGAALCSLCFGCFFWIMRLPSLGPITGREWVNLIFYLIATSSCYLGIFWLLDRYFILSLKGARLNWIVVALFGTLLSFIVLWIPVWQRRTSLTVQALWSDIRILGFLSLAMLAIMAFVWSIGVILRLIGKEIIDSKVVPD